MPLPTRIREKRALNGTEILQHALSHQQHDSEDSLDDTASILEAAHFMTTFRFQQFLNSLPMSKSQRQQSERNYMRAVLLWKVGRADEVAA